MIAAKNIRVFTLSRDSLTVSWEIENTSESLSDYTIYILRSQSEAGPFEVVSPAISASATDSFVDTGVNLYSKFRAYFYRVRVKLTSGDSYTDFGSSSIQEVLKGEAAGSVSLGGLPDLEALEAIRRFDLAAKEYIGRKVLVLTRRTTGTRCSDCWDALKRRRTRSDCRTCYATGVVGGYYAPKQTFAVKPPTQNAAQLTGLFELEINDCIMWISSTPRVKPRDLVIDADGKRWRAVAVRRSEKLWSLTRQTVQLREISKDQVDYNIGVSSWDVNQLTSSPLRQFIRANDIDSFRKAEQDIGEAFRDDS
jgi:hypothetical protein